KELNRKDYPPETKPIAMIKDTISNCDGVIVLGFKQIRIIKGREKGGTKDPRTLINTFLPTAWNHIEATIGYMLDVPVLVIQEGVSGGIFDAGTNDFLIHQIAISGRNPFRSREFDPVLNQWFRDVKFPFWSKPFLNH
ncbi:MAG TPA: hypothetical protein VH500_04625, partial [Nitrososphaeraceae archaeon]